MVLEFWAQMLLAYRIAGFFKIHYLKKEVNDEVYLWHADKQWSLLQVESVILSVSNQACPKYPK